MSNNKVSIDVIGEAWIPKIQFTKYAMKWISAIVESHSEEVGFYGIVDEEDGVYTITDIFYPKHELVTGTTCEIDPAGMQQIMMHLLSKGLDSEIGKLKMWGHSHVRMAVGPSGQDEKQALELVRDNGDYLIRIIANKKGEIGITFFSLDTGYKYSDLPYTVVESDEEKQDMLDAISSVMNSNNADVDLVNVIRNIVTPKSLIDDEYRGIVDKVNAMKKDNIPTPKPHYYNNYKKNNTANFGRQYAKPAEKKVDMLDDLENYYDEMYGNFMQ
jgi:hypothetical protein